MVFKYRSARYEIAVLNPNGVNQGVAAMLVDGISQPAGEARLQLLDDGAIHRIELTLGVAHVQRIPDPLHAMDEAGNV